MQYCVRFEWFEGLMFRVLMMLSNVIVDVTISDCARISDTVSVPLMIERERLFCIHICCPVQNRTK